MTSDPPKYRPLERFWPYADLLEQPTDAELASLDPDLHEALFGQRPRPFSITLVFPALDVPAFSTAIDLARASAEPEKKRQEDRILHVSSFRDPVREIDKLTELYESLAEARREVGQDAPPFHKFAELVKSQVTKLRKSGAPEVAFRVAVKNGKLNFTAKGMKGAK